MVNVSNVWQYVQHVVRHWVTLVAGALIAVGGFIAAASGRSLPPAVFWAAGGALIIVSQYLAWLDAETRLEAEQLEHTHELAAAAAHVVELERIAEERFAAVRYTLALQEVDFRFVPNDDGDLCDVYPTLVFENVGSDWLSIMSGTNIVETCGRRRTDVMTGNDEGIRIGPGASCRHQVLPVQKVLLSDLTRSGSSCRIQYNVLYRHPAGGPVYRRTHDLNVIFLGQHHPTTPPGYWHLSTWEDNDGPI